jgi:carbonic anhydrase
MCEDDANSKDATGLSRRHFLTAGSLAAMAPWGIQAAAASDTPAQANAVSPEAALKRLMDGNGRYAANNPEHRDFSANRAALAKAQYPIAAILSCADSRVAPELAFDQDPGDLFIMRVAGNVMSRDLLASLEYGVKFLNIPLVMVLGHTNCGAVSAAIGVVDNDAELPGHLPSLIGRIKPAVLKAREQKTGNLLNRSIVQNVRAQVAEIKQEPPIVNGYYNDGKIDVVGGVYDLKTGKINLV